MDSPLLPCAPRELRQKAALADSRRADDRDEGRPLLGDRCAPHLRQRFGLTLAADERDGVGDGLMRLVFDPDRLPDTNRLRFALRSDRLGLAVVDRVSCRHVRQLADEDAVDRSRRLEARGRVHHVTRGDALALARSRADDHERFARVDADADLQIQPLVLGVQLVDRAADGERCANGSLRIVLVRDRRAEQRDDRVADELLDRAAEVLQLGPEADIVRR